MRRSSAACCAGCACRGAILGETYFEDCDFSGARFVATGFLGTGFFGCRMDGALFVGCHGVVFAGSASKFDQARVVACALQCICLQRIQLERNRWSIVASPVKLADGKPVESGRVQWLGEIRRIDSK